MFSIQTYLKLTNIHVSLIFMISKNKNTFLNKKNIRFVFVFDKHDKHNISLSVVVMWYRVKFRAYGLTPDSQSFWLSLYNIL